MAGDIGITLRGNAAPLQVAMQQGSTAVNKFGDDATRSLKRVQDDHFNLHKSLSSIGGQLGTALTAAFAVSQVSAFTSAIIDAQVNVDRLRNTMTYALGASNAGAELDYMRKTTNALGLEFNSASQLYAKFAAAAKGTALEGRGAKDAFESIGKATTVMGLSAESTGGVMLALTQILSKGKVQAEEIRGQLGERLPGAFALAAESMSMTTAEFSKALEMGQVMSEDFIPKFSALMETKFAGSFKIARDSMQSNLNVMSNAWIEFKTTLAEGGASNVIKNEVRGITNDLQGMTDMLKASQAAGDGLGMQFANMTGFVIGKGVVELFNLSANALRGSVNALTGGFFDLNKSVQWFPESMMNNGQKAIYLAQQLKTAEADLAQLSSKLAMVPDNIYLKSEAHAAWLLVQELRAAKKAKDDLTNGSGVGGGRGSVNPMTIGQLQERNDKNAADRAALVFKQSGVPADYIKTVNEIVRLDQAGALAAGDFAGMMEKAKESLNKRASGGSRTKPIDEAAKGVALYNDLIAKSSGFTSNYAEQMLSLSLAASKGALSVGEVATAVSLINAQQPGALAELKANQEGLDELFKTIGVNEKIRQSYVDAQEAAQDYLDTVSRQSARTLAGLGRGDRFRADQSGINSIEDRLTDKKSELLRDNRNGKFGEEEYKNYLALAQRTYEQELAIYNQSLADKTTAQGNWVYGANEAMANYITQASETANSMQSVFTNAFQGMEDALTNFVTTGKLDFNSLADSIVAGITRIIIQQQMIKPMAEFLQGGMSSGSGLGGLIGSGLTSMFGGGSGIDPSFASGMADPFAKIITGGSMRANGGPVSAGQMYQVNEKGPELLNVGSRQYLLMGSQGGSVTPNNQIAGGGGNSVTVNIHQQFAPGTTRATTLQAAADASRQLSAAGRNL